MITKMASFKNRLLAPYNGLNVTWYDGWHPALDEALLSLPERETCPHELFRLMIQNPGSTPKRIALVTKQETPLAIIPLRQLGRWNYEVSTWMIPGAMFPAKTENMIPALEALKNEIWVNWRGMENPSPSSRLIRYSITTPLHLIRCSDDYERYWREKHHFKTVRKIRNRCKDFSLIVNSPGSAEWTIRNAADKWRNDPKAVGRGLDDWVVSDWVVAANHLENLGRHYTLMLFDKDIPIGGSTLFVLRNCAVGGLIYRKPEYNWYGVGSRLLDLCISFAAESGFEILDLGGAADYKNHWAPREEEFLLFKLCPEPLFRAKQAANWAREAKEKLINRVRGNRVHPD